MQAKPFDTLAIARDLEAAGMANGQAEAIAVAIRDARADLVTKADLDALESRFEARLAALESKQDARLAALESKQEAQLVALEGRLEAKLANTVNRMLLGQVAIAGLLFAALKLFG